MLGAAALLGLAAPAPAWAADVTRRALVIGANDGGLDLQPLRYAEEDAWRMAGVLQELGGFSPADVTVLVSPTEERVQAELARAAAELGAADETLFLFYYSGHADPSGLRLGSDLYPYAALKEDIREVPADVHLGIVDACRSGALTRVKGASVSAPFLADAPLDAEGEAWLAAAAADEDAQESDRIEGSFFTHYLLSGLRGAADTGDGWVSLNEAYTYAYDRTVARTGGTEAGTQHPSYDFQLQGNGDLRLTEVKRATATVRFPSELEGEILVLRQPEGTPVAEVAKPAGRELDLALAPGRYLMRRRVEGEIQEVTVSLSKGSTHTVNRWGDAVAEASNLKGARTVAPSRERQRRDLDVPMVDDVVGTIREVTGSCERGDLESNPCVSALASSIVPGGGQFVNQDYLRGALYGGAVIGLAAAGFKVGGLTAGGGELWAKGAMGPNPLLMGAMMMYGLSISDAAWKARERDTDYDRYRPRTGFELSAESTWTGDLDRPYITGLAVDYIPVRRFTLGLDKTGWSLDDAGTMHLWTGTRGGLNFDARRFRLSPFFAVGVHYQRHAGGASDLTYRLATGGQVRWYATPRYFLVGETRVEWEQQTGPSISVGGGMGVHFGG